MSTLIVYGTKYGFTGKCAKALENELNGSVDIINLQSESIKDLSGYEKIIIGGSIYAGQLRKNVKQFCVDNLNMLLSKKIGLYISCSMTGDDAIKQIKNAFPEALYNRAVIKDYLGGEVNLEKARFFDRLIIKMVSKFDDSTSNRNNGICMYNVKRFADAINNC
ncbi:flavodoxin domain-containing protein [Vallitalea guaymasensis]|uniref:flavodoxin domain-containing protein n=1 Tax=Vallitalea guaymasensis TaxID=1185412 RepID=UPI0023570153|nr:flavodoxin domain-containing protein [Vallitalea guaymasensis]